MEHGGMIPVSNQIANFSRGKVGIGLGQIHSYLTGLHDIALA